MPGDLSKKIVAPTSIFLTKHLARKNTSIQFHRAEKLKAKIYDGAILPKYQGKEVGRLIMNERIYGPAVYARENPIKNALKKNCYHISDLLLRIYALGPRCNSPS